ncbi:MAG: AIPR family protein [Gallionella sp.]|nr:AIPR family protein [Gallionella sp.]
MSLTILLNDQIDKLFKANTELNSVNKNQFEIAVVSFANSKYLHGIEFDDLVDGVMGEGGDEGIDHCYIFCNGMLVADESHPINKESHVKVKFFQTKKEQGFSTDGFRKVKEGIEEIFNLDIDLDKLQKIGANKDILDKADLIRRLFRKASLERAKFSCEVFYVTAAPETKLSEKIKHLANELKENKLRIPFEFYFWGAQEVLDLTEGEDETIEVQFNSQPLEIKERGVQTNGFSGFVTGNNIVRCLQDEKGAFKAHLTEGNVRFFLGEDIKINNSIIETAKDKSKAENFWAMNNGLTIIGDSITPLGNNQYAVLNPQIVNGCQTIHCLYHAYKELDALPDLLKIFVKLVNTDNLDVQTDIISATNSQNPVKSASLKANDNIQRNIEKHLKKSEIYYERRESYYKKQGFTGNKVIGLLKMAQIIHTVVNKESIVALNDTATLFETSSKYDSIFSDLADFDIYTFATILYQKIWSLKNSDLRNNEYPEDKRDLISKGGLVFLHCMSSLILSKAEFKTDEDKKTELCTKNIVISVPARKNEFVKRKESALNLIKDDHYLKDRYEEAKEILEKAAAKYSLVAGKSKSSLLKNRNFDRDYLRPEIDAFLQAQLKKAALQEPA